MNYSPNEAQQVVIDAAVKVAEINGLPKDWLNSQAMQLDVLPNGWLSRRIHICKYSKMSIYAASRLDLLCMKFYANRPQDREDIIAMKPTPEEMCFVRKYLDVLRLPSRLADLDQIVSALKLVDAMEGLFGEC